MKPKPQVVQSARTQRKILPAKVSIVGAGVVGSTLGALLFEKGFEIVSIINRSAAPALSLAKATKCRKVSGSDADVSPDTEFLLFAVSDDVLPDVIRQCAKNSQLRKPLVAHTSGVHSIEVLKPFQRQGFMVASLHPIQSFPKTKSLRERMKSVRGIHFGVEGEGKALAMIQHIVYALGARTLVIPQGVKPLYHATCVFASNYVVTLLNAVAEASQALGFNKEWREFVLPLFTTSVGNALTTSPREALTGPIVRNDIHTIELHLGALQKFAPQLVPLYCVAGIETARIARQNGNLTTEQFRNFVSRIRRYVRSI